MNIEDRIFELFGEDKAGLEIAPQIVAEFGVDDRSAWDLIIKVHKERGTPRRVRTRQAIEQLRMIRFV
jgi:hypothetical protein